MTVVSHGVCHAFWPWRKFLDPTPNDLCFQRLPVRLKIHSLQSPNCSLHNCKGCSQALVPCPCEDEERSTKCCPFTYLCACRDLWLHQRLLWSHCSRYSVVYSDFSEDTRFICANIYKKIVTLFFRTLRCETDHGDWRWFPWVGAPDPTEGSKIVGVRKVCS